MKEAPRCHRGVIDLPCMGWVLDPVFQGQAELEIVVQVNPMSDNTDARSLAGYMSDEGKKSSR